MGKVSKSPGREVLYQLHAGENKNIYEIVEIYGVNRTTIKSQ